MRTKNNEFRFKEKISKGDANACWEWRGAQDGRGYGSFWLDGKLEKAHRASLILLDGIDISSGMCVCHSCDNPICVNPNHLWLGTHTDNMHDLIKKNKFPYPKPGCWYNKQKTHCKRGHEFTKENTIITSQGRRACKICQYMHNKVYRRKKKITQEALKND